MSEEQQDMDLLATLEEIQAGLQIYLEYYGDIDGRIVGLMKQIADTREIAGSIIERATQDERAACNQIAVEVNRQSSALMKNTTTEVNRSYYVGRCNGACLISQRICARS